MDIDVVDRQGEVVGSVAVSDGNFGAEFNEALVHQVTVACRARQRAGTKAQKNRTAVRGGSAKPWRQKGVGRARAGTTSSPIFRGGGRTFAASPRSYAQKVNKKSLRTAMRSLLSEVHRRGMMTVVKEMELEEHKTKVLSAQLATLNCSSALIVDAEVSENLDLASRNLRHVNVISTSMLNPALVLDSKQLLITEQAIQSVDEWLQ